MVRVIFGGLGFGAACLLLAGCGRGKTGFDVAGAVSYDGKPVPAGKVYFTPDASKQNSGPQSVGEIKDGRYDTRNGRAGSGGPVLVHIEGFDGQRTAERPLGNAVFTFETKADLPKENTSKDFNITAAEATKVDVTGPSP
jgi:hypothetical protein